LRIRCGWKSATRGKNRVVLAIQAYRSTRDDRVFHIHSRWIDEAAFEAHARLPHNVGFVQQVPPLIDHPVAVTRARPLDL
jgi:quinol monooxygenase YgiN